jgi:hypothetical protein
MGHAHRAKRTDANKVASVEQPPTRSHLDGRPLSWISPSGNSRALQIHLRVAPRSTGHAVSTDIK